MMNICMRQWPPSKKNSKYLSAEITGLVLSYVAAFFAAWYFSGDTFPDLIKTIGNVVIKEIVFIAGILIAYYLLHQEEYRHRSQHPKTDLKLLFHNTFLTLTLNNIIKGIFFFAALKFTDWPDTLLPFLLYPPIEIGTYALRHYLNYRQGFFDIAKKERKR